MKAVQIHGFGGNEAVKLDDVPERVPGEKELLVSVRFASVNPVDLFIRDGYMSESIKDKLPATLGGDFSGMVEGVGEKVKGFSKGDDVFGYATILGAGSGSFADFLTVDSDKAGQIPDRMDMMTAASIPLAGMSAYDVIYNKMKLEKGDRILVHGASGGIGHIAVQMAKKLGARVFATSSPQGVGFVKSLGAEEVRDYKQDDFDSVFSDLDFVFDTIGGKVLERSLGLLGRGRIVVTMGGLPDPSVVKKLGIQSIAEHTQKNMSKAHFEEMAQTIVDSEIKVNADKVFKLKDIKEAFDYFEKGHPLGKILLKGQGPDLVSGKGVLY